MARPSPQLDYQKCIRTSDFKVLCHYPPFNMKRYHQLDDLLDKVTKRITHIIDPSKKHEIEGARNNHSRKNARYYWTDLKKDPDEARPVRVKKEPNPEAAFLIQELEKIYQDRRSGPPIDVEKFDETVLFQRLADLGYIDPQ